MGLFNGCCIPALAAVVAAHALIGASGATLEPISAGDQVEWNPRMASREVARDMSNLLMAFNRDRPELMEILAEFRATRIKDVGIRRLALWGITLARVYDVATEVQAPKVYARMKDMTERLLSVYERKYSFVESRVMRGWPMIVDPRDKYETFEAYNFGHIGMAIAECARVTARLGRHQEAMDMLEPVLATLYDGYLVPDPEMTKLDSQGRVVYVPIEASAMRKQRQIFATAGAQDKCVTEPQAYNHGLLVARAAMAAELALQEIVTGKWNVTWPMTEEWTTPAVCMERLKWLVTQNAQWLRGAFKKQPPTGSDNRDNYQGPDGQDWYQWDYRDLSNCDMLRGTSKDRLEDIAHAAFEVNFVAEAREWSEGLGLEQIFAHKDIHRLIVTFLNRVVHDYDAPSDKRFACDVAGVIDGDNWGNADKQCGSKFRTPEKRAKHALGWLNLAHSIWDLRENENFRLLRCDVLRMVSAVLPLTLPDSDEFDAYNFEQLDQAWAAEAIKAKYYFYNYRQQIDAAC